MRLRRSIFLSHVRRHRSRRVHMLLVHPNHFHVPNRVCRCMKTRMRRQCHGGRSGSVDAVKDRTEVVNHRLAGQTLSNNVITAPFLTLLEWTNYGYDKTICVLYSIGQSSWMFRFYTLIGQFHSPRSVIHLLYIRISRIQTDST